MCCLPQSREQDWHRSSSFMSEMENIPCGDCPRLHVPASCRLAWSRSTSSYWRDAGLCCGSPAGSQSRWPLLLKDSWEIWGSGWVTDSLSLCSLSCKIRDLIPQLRGQRVADLGIQYLWLFFFFSFLVNTNGLNTLAKWVVYNIKIQNATNMLIKVWEICIPVHRMWKCILWEG